MSFKKKRKSLIISEMLVAKYESIVENFLKKKDIFVEKRSFLNNNAQKSTKTPIILYPNI